MSLQSTPGSPGKPRALVVDDDGSSRAIVASYLRRTGYDVDTAHDGARALEMLCSQPQGYAVVVSDVTMPRLAGDALATHVRSQLQLEVPIVLMSGTRLDDLRASRLGGVACIAKPFLPDDLGRVIAEAVGSARSS